MQVMREDQQRHRVLGGASRSRLLTILAESGSWLSVQELAQAARLHPNTAREHVEQLVDAGLVECKRSEPNGRGRPAFLYRARRQVDEAAAYRALAGILADAVAHRQHPADDAIAAGQRWGKSLIRSPLEPTGPVDKLVQLLDELGFDPALTSADSVIELRRCPFGPLARIHGNVICNAHLGLMRGALTELDAPAKTVRLEPFVNPSLCLAHLGSAHDAG